MDQVYVVPFGTIELGKLFVGVMLNVFPLQAAAFCPGNNGVGLIVIVRMKLFPGHNPLVPDVGVTVYVAV